MTYTYKKFYSKNDEYYTPIEALLPLKRYLKGKVFDPAYGTGQLIKNLISLDIDAFGIKKFNFLKDELPECNMIVTNPPYSLKDQFLEKAYGYNKPFCMLLPITALGGIRRNKLFRYYGIQLYILDKRINFGAKNVPFNVAWFCWKVLPKDLMFWEVK